ncbi:MAG: ribosome maturation factor RimP [Gammaproteobacteria bacterium]|nr:ribosome maturation factor RimP [Gammaproteobacteria bacterium]
MGLFYWSFDVRDLTELFAPVVESMGYELVGVEFSGGSGHGTLRVYIDHEDGVNLDDCASISHQISAILDVEEQVQQAYNLEISSPGLDRPLFKLEDYQRFSGQVAKIKMAIALDGRRNFKGVLQAVVEPNLIEIEVDGEVYQLPLADIGKANLVGHV